VVTLLRPSFVTLRPPLGVEPDSSLTCVALHRSVRVYN
jgi:hypothetical protein